ncbi:MAG: saccharopine dehydrogenase NADP-binding domain-containing protein [Thermoprotei archaeon]
MSKIIVLGGAGHIGSRIVKELRELNSSVEITIADKNVEKANDVAKDVGGSINVVDVDASVEDLVVSMLKGYDAAINAIGPFYRFGVPILRAAIRAGVNFVDINDDYDATLEALKLHEEAQKRNVTAIIGLGATPGITNLLAKYGSEKFDEVHEIGTYWVWTAIDPTMGPAIIDHYFHAITGMIKTYKDGAWVDIKALSEPERYEFPQPIGVWEVAHAGHPEPITIPHYIKVRSVYNKGGVWPSDLNDIAKAFSMLGLTSLKMMSIKEQAYVARDVAIAITLALPELTPPEEIERTISSLYERLGEYALTGVGLGVMVKGIKNGSAHIIKYGVACREASQATALPAALAALELASSQGFKSGVYPPEAGVVDVSKLLNGIKKVFTIEYSEVQYGTL